MEIFTFLETLEDILENSKKLPFTDKVIVNKEELVEIIQEIRLMGKRRKTTYFTRSSKRG